MYRFLSVMALVAVAFLVAKALLVAAIFASFVLILGVLGIFAPIIKRRSGAHKHLSSPLVDPLNGFKEIR